jgi:hypothetical protein
MHCRVIHVFSVHIFVGTRCKSEEAGPGTGRESDKASRHITVNTTPKKGRVGLWFPLIPYSRLYGEGPYRKMRHLFDG